MLTNDAMVVANKSTNECVLETSNKKILKKINLDKYKIVPILAHLQSLNVVRKEKEHT